MELNWPTNMQEHKWHKETLRIAVLAYTDDTIYMANSKEEIEEITRIAEEFYEINELKSIARNQNLWCYTLATKKSPKEV